MTVVGAAALVVVGVAAGLHAGLLAVAVASVLALGLVVTAALRRLAASCEDRLEVARREARLRERAATIVQSLSHEFRTPLTLIIGPVETLQARGLVVDDGQPLIEVLHRGTRRLEALISMITAAADELPGDIDGVPVDPQALVQEVADQIRHHGGHERVQVVVATGERAIVTQPEFLRALLLALVDNALKFSPDREAVEVEVDLVDEAVRFRVRDHGAGIDEALAAELFQPFSQLDAATANAKGGLGLGLYAARRLAERLGGTLALEAHPDGGCVATVSLPQRRESDQVDLDRRGRRRRAR